MSHVKAGGTANNVHNNAGHRLDVKRFGGQAVKAGEVASLTLGNLQGDTAYRYRLLFTATGAGSATASPDYALHTARAAGTSRHDDRPLEQRCHDGVAGDPGRDSRPLPG